MSFDFRHWARIIVFGAMLTAIIAFALVSRQFPQFRSRAMVLIRFGPGGGDWNQAATTYAQLVRGTDMLNVALQSLSQVPNANGGDSTHALTADVLAEMTTVALIPDTQLLAIDVTAPDSVEAQTLAGSIAHQLVATADQLSANPDAFSIHTQISALQSQVDSARSEWQNIDQQILATHDANTLADLRTRRTDVIDRYLLLETNLTALTTQYEQLTSGTPTLSIADSASTAVPITTSPFFGALIGLVAGGVGSALICFWLENRDATLRSANAIRFALDLPTLASLPPLRAKPGEEKLIVNAEPSYTEPYRALAVALGLPTSASGWTIGITSPASDEGKSLTTANLALAVAQTGRRTLIIDVDLRTPAQHRLFKVSNRQGLTGILHEFSLRADAEGDDESLADLLPVNQVIKQSEIANLNLLTSGPLPANPEDLFVSPYLVRLIRALAGRYDAVLIDLPSALSSSAVSGLAPCLDATVLVIDAQRTRRQAARKAARVLSLAGVRLSGVVLNRVRLRTVPPS